MKHKIDTSSLEWQEGKVKNFFGKELINLENGSVKLVKIAPKGEYPLHIHPDKTEYVHVLKGQLMCRIGTEEHTGTVGDFFVFPQNVYHALSNCNNEECVVLVGAIKI